MEKMNEVLEGSEVFHLNLSHKRNLKKNSKILMRRGSWRVGPHIHLTLLSKTTFFLFALPFVDYFLVDYLSRRKEL